MGNPKNTPQSLPIRSKKFRQKLKNEMNATQTLARTRAVRTRFGTLSPTIGARRPRSLPQLTGTETKRDSMHETEQVRQGRRPTQARPPP